MRYQKALQMFCVAVLTLLLVHCAKRGRPSGGPIDEEPPVVTTFEPPNYSTGFQGNEIEIRFNEFIKFEGLQEQLIISPPLEYRPIISPQGGTSKRIKVKILDTLKPNTTYTINFGQSIIDNNEGNPYPYLKYVFSTGEYVDSLQLSGKVVDALAREPEDFISVMLYQIDEEYTDSTVFKEKPRYLTNTLDSLTDFTLENLMPGTYQMIALKDRNRNLMFDPLVDQIGFVKQPITVPTDSSFLLRMFDPVPAPAITRVFQKSARQLGIGYQGKMDSMEVGVLDGSKISLARIIKPEPIDTLQYWFQPSREIDSLQVEISLGDFGHQETVKIREMEEDSLTIKELEGFDFRKSPRFQASIPIKKVDTTYFQLIDQDSAVVPFSTRLNRFENILELDFQREESSRYALTMLPGAIQDIYGETNDTIKANFTTQEYNQYGNLNINVQSDHEMPLILQVLTEDLEVVAEEPVVPGEETSFLYLEPNDYLLRVIYDENSNGRYDPGDFLNKRQPEKVVYFPNLIQLSQNWDVTETFVVE